MVPFLEKVFHDLADPLDYSDVRKLSSMLSTLANEKQRIEKEKKSGKKGTSCSIEGWYLIILIGTKKAQVKVEASAVDAADGEGFTYDDNYDDFM
jgi:hypothetical protein